MKPNIEVDVTQIVDQFAKDIRVMREDARLSVNDATYQGYVTTYAAAPVDTGVYRDSIGTKYFYSKTSFNGDIGTDDPRGIWLEIGTFRTKKDGSRTWAPAKQPHFILGAETAEEKLYDELTKRIAAHA